MTRKLFRIKTTNIFWTAVALLVASTAVLPFLNLFFSWTDSSQKILEIFSASQLFDLITNTFILGFIVAISTLILGVSLAWITTMTTFPGRKLFSWLLCLPMALPAYVLGFVYIGLFDYSGPFQSFLRSSFHFGGYIPFRSLLGLSFVLTISLYPYIYLLTRQAFITQSKQIQESAILFGTNHLKLFVDFALPLAKPWILAGLVIVLMEIFADFGTVSIFSYVTFTTSIYKAWYGYFSIETAAQLSTVLGIIALIFILTKNYFSKNQQQHFDHSLYSQSIAPIRTSLIFKILATTLCLTLVAFGILIPGYYLLNWSISAWTPNSLPHLTQLITNTMIIALLASFNILLLTFLAACAERFTNKKWIMILNSLSTLGYGIPGSVFAVAIFFILNRFSVQIIENFNSIGINLSDMSIITTSLLPIILGLYSRFFAISFHPIQNGFFRISRSQDDIANMMGAKKLSILIQIHLPQMRLPMMTAFILVFLEIIKEMPLTVMTRPFGWDTLSVNIFELTSEGEWTRAAIPSLFLMLVGIIPVIFMRKSFQ